VALPLYIEKKLIQHDHPIISLSLEGEGEGEGEKLIHLTLPLK
jgi:hypothetical protein